MVDPISSLDVRESVSGDDRLSSDSSNSTHGKSTIQQLGGFLLLHLFRVRRSKFGPSKV